MKSILLFLIFCLNLNAQTASCDLEYLAQVESNIGKLSEKEITSFLKTLKIECNANVEFSEFYNELLFKIAERHTSQLINCLSKIDPEKRKLILLEFENNLIEIDMEKLIEKVQNCKGNEKIKTELLNSLSRNK